MSWITDSRYMFLIMLAVALIAAVVFLSPLALRQFSAPPAQLVVVPPSSTPMPGQVSDLTNFIAASEQNITQQLQTVISITFELIAFLAALSAVTTIISGKRTEDTAKQMETTLVQVKEAEQRLAQIQTESQRIQGEMTRLEHHGRDLAERFERDLSSYQNQMKQYSLKDSVQKVMNSECSVEERRKELDQLAQMYNPAAITVFCYVLEFEKEMPLLYAGAHGLGVLELLARNSQTLALLLKHTHSPDAAVRKQCIESLGNIALPADSEVLQQIMNISQQDGDSLTDVAKKALSRINARNHL